MKSSSIIWIIAAALVVVAGFAIYKQSNLSATQAPPQSQSSEPTTQSQGAPAAPATQQGESPATVTSSPSPAPQSFTINGTDAGADVTDIMVAVGTPVSITFSADAEETYHGGLDFRSPIVSTGTIAPGATKTVNFTATKSFVFTPYWPASNIVKPYRIKVNVQ